MEKSSLHYNDVEQQTTVADLGGQEVSRNLENF
jgi:hypothetical protein